MDKPILQVARKIDNHVKKEVHDLAILIGHRSATHASILSAFATMVLADLLVKGKIMLRSDDART